MPNLGIEDDLPLPLAERFGFGVKDFPFSSHKTSERQGTYENGTQQSNEEWGFLLLTLKPTHSQCFWPVAGILYVPPEGAEPAFRPFSLLTASSTFRKSTANKANAKVGRVV
jgi:hypothetical protein